MCSENKNKKFVLLKINSWDIKMAIVEETPSHHRSAE